jgi:hypothetical protein
MAVFQESEWPGVKDDQLVWRGARPPLSSDSGTINFSSFWLLTYDLAQLHEFYTWRGCSGHFETLGLCRISIYAWIPDSWEMIWNKCDFLLFFFSALNLPLAVESGSRKINGSRRQWLNSTLLALALERRPLFRQMESNPLLSLHRYECMCWYKICKR